MLSIVVAQNEQSRKPWLREKHLSLRLGDTPIPPTNHRTPAPVREAYRLAVRERARWARARIGTVVAKVDLNGKVRWAAPSPVDAGAEFNRDRAIRVGDAGKLTEALAELSMIISVIYAALPHAQEHLSKEFHDAAELLGSIANELEVTEEFWQAMEQTQTRAQALLVSLMARTVAVG